MRAYARSQAKPTLAHTHTFSNVIDNTPSSFARRRGFARDKLCLFDDAISDYTEALRIEPDNAYAYYNRGISRDRAGQYSEAIADFTLAINVLPGNADFYHNRGFCHRKQGNLQDAINDYRWARIGARSKATKRCEYPGPRSEATNR